MSSSGFSLLTEHTISELLHCNGISPYKWTVMNECNVDFRKCTKEWQCLFVTIVIAASITFCCVSTSFSQIGGTPLLPLLREREREKSFIHIITQDTLMCPPMNSVNFNQKLFGYFSPFIPEDSFLNTYLKLDDIDVTFLLYNLISFFFFFQPNKLTKQYYFGCPKVKTRIYWNNFSTSEKRVNFWGHLMLSTIIIKAKIWCSYFKI